MAKILVVDDSRTVRNFLSQRLTSFGAEVTLAVDGVEALKQARNHRFDLIITDLDMPRMDGFKLCQEIRRNPTPGAPPVLIMSADFNDNYIEQGFKVGAWGYVPKYNLNNELLPRVRDVLAHKRFTPLWRVLVADNSQTASTLMRKELSAVGFQVLCAETGQQAIVTIKSHRPDLVICDLCLPDMKAQDLLAHLKDDNTLKKIPFIVLSHEDSHATAIKMMENGASSYLMKPFNPGQLISLASRVMTNCHKELEKENDALTGEFEKMFGGIADLVKALEARDPFTSGHSQGVTDISLRIGHALGLPSNKLKRLQLAARLHDLGKISLNDAILLKPGELTEEEKRAVRRHPETGAKLLRPFSQLKDIVPAVYQHHERWDGTGYPSKIKGPAINLFARIIAVADTFDSLTSNRPYRKAVSTEEAMKTIEAEAGKQLCPECVSAFANIMKKADKVATCLCDTGEDLAQLRKSKRRSSIRGKSIVVADGNRLFFKDVCTELKACGARTVSYARDGNAAWEMINATKADILICDWEVSGLCCRELLEKMAWSEEFSTIGTIITSHSVDNGQLASIVGMRPSGILVKPFTLKDLIVQVEKVLCSVQKENGNETPAPQAATLPAVAAQAVDHSSQMIQSFSKGMTEQYTLRFHRFFSVNSLSLPVKEASKANVIFTKFIKKRFTSPCERDLSQVIMKTETNEAQFRKSMADFVNCSHNRLQELSVDLYSHFQAQLMQCLHAKFERFANNESVNWVVDEFRIDIVHKTNELHESLIGMLNDSLKQCQALTQGEHKLALYNLVDAFGRGLMEPLNEVYPIRENVKGSCAQKKHFPRFFCAPVLEVVRHFVIGPTQYDKANKKILKSVNRFIGKAGDFDPASLRAYFTHDKIRQYYVTSFLYCLKKLTSEVRRENFIRKINKQLRRSRPEIGEMFDERAWTMLSRAWAMSALNNLGETQKTNKAVETILSHYLPTQTIRQVSGGRMQ